MKNEKNLLDDLLPDNQDFKVCLYEAFGDEMIELLFKAYDMFHKDEELTPEMQERFDRIRKRICESLEKDKDKV